MATEIDHDEIKKKIVAILEANTTLYTTSAESDKIRNIDVGFPQGSFNGVQLSDAMLPYIYVTNSSGPFELISSGEVVSNAHKILTHTFNYNIVTVVLEKDSRQAEIKLDDYQKLILETLEADHNLTGVGSASVDDSVPVRVDELRVGTADQGRGLKGRIITLRCTKVTS